MFSSNIISRFGVALTRCTNFKERRIHIRYLNELIVSDTEKKEFVEYLTHEDHNNEFLDIFYQVIKDRLVNFLENEMNF